MRPTRVIVAITVCAGLWLGVPRMHAFATPQVVAARAAVAPVDAASTQAAPVEAAPVEAAATEAAAPVAALTPFVASYQVLDDGRTLGTATMQLTQVDAERWRIDLGMRGSGLLRVTGLNFQQSTLFANHANDYRPLSQALVKRVLLSNRKTVGVYDWSAGSARWTGDIKQTRRAPVHLQPGDMSGLLINLAVIRDAEPGKSLHYRYVDDGRARDHVYQVAPDTEPVAVGDLHYSAMRVERAQSGEEQMVIWVASGVPTPIRILQRKNGRDEMDLRLVEYH